MLRVWGRRNSFNVQKVLWLVGELGLPYEHVPAGGSFGRLDDPDFRALNPHGMIPVVEEDGAALWESHAILRYLAARHGQGVFWSEDPAARAVVDGWMEWSETALQPPFLQGLFQGYFRTPEAQRDWPAIRRSQQACAELYGLLDQRLAGQPFVVGDALSLADITVGATLYRYYEMDIEKPSLPHLEAYYRRLTERPAYSENVMISFAELRG